MCVVSERDKRYRRRRLMAVAASASGWDGERERERERERGSFPFGTTTEIRIIKEEEEELRRRRIWSRFFVFMTGCHAIIIVVVVRLTDNTYMGLKAIMAVRKCVVHPRRELWKFVSSRKTSLYREANKMLSVCVSTRPARGGPIFSPGAIF